MRITAVIGSPHKNGNTSTLARWMLEEARDAGAVTEEMFLAEKHIEYCKGCIGQKLEKTCMSTGLCRIEDDVNALREKLYQSDGIVLASPSYGMMPTARMKNFMVDRIGMFTAYTSSLGGKYFVGLSTAGGIGAKKVARSLADHFLVGFHQRAYLTGVLSAHVGYGNIHSNSEWEKEARLLGRKLVLDIEKKRTYPFQRLTSRIVNRLLVRKIIMNNIYKNKDGELKGVYQNLKEKNSLAL